MSARLNNATGKIEQKSTDKSHIKHIEALVIIMIKYKKITILIRIINQTYYVHL